MLNKNAAQFTPIYTTYSSVKVRLAGKVQFQQDPENPVDGELPNDLLGQLIIDAETYVEQQLRGRYMIPFQSISNGTYETLPDHTRRVIRVLCDAKAVMYVLNTDFGRGTAVEGISYYKTQKEIYDENLALALGQDLEGASENHKRYRFTPPLEGMRLAATNIADDGYRGKIINSDPRPDATTYAEHQINNPSRSYVNVMALRGRRR